MVLVIEVSPYFFPAGYLVSFCFLFLSLYRSQPKEEGESSVGGKIKPLYDIPYVFEAREFLRKKLIGKKVCARLQLSTQTLLQKSIYGFSLRPSNPPSISVSSPPSLLLLVLSFTFLKFLHFPFLHFFLVFIHSIFFSPSTQVNVVVDYIKPAQDTFPEKTCCTVTREGM